MADTPRRPNILLVTTDQQRYDTLGVTGNPHVRTPHLDQLAARGTLFRHGYIQNPVCMPSRACMQTGRYAHQHGMEHMESVIGTTPGLPPWETTFMERLQDSGYTTATFGKIHMLPPKGFDETALTMGKGSRWTVAEGSPFGPSQLGPVYAEWLERKRPGAYESIYEQRRRPEYRQQSTAIVNTLAADEYVDYWIGENTWRYLERPDTGTPERPFFLWCGFCGPHGPFDPPEPYASMYEQDAIAIPPLLYARQLNAPGSDRPSRFERAGGEDLIRKIIAYYWGMVSFIDTMMGRIMDTLTRRGLLDNTLIIFTTDHGEMLGDFGMLGKGNFTEQVIRAPYIVVPPGSESGAGVRPEGPRPVDSLVEHIDLAPTILDYAGIPQPGELPGISLRSILESPMPTNRPPTKDAILCEYVSNDRRHRSKCLRTERYKYVYAGRDNPVEFYDLERDPQELVNVAGDPAYRDEVQRHAELLLDRLLTTEQTVWNHGGMTPPDRDGFDRPVAAGG